MTARKEVLLGDFSLRFAVMLARRVENSVHRFNIAWREVPIERLPRVGIQPDRAVLG